MFESAPAALGTAESEGIDTAQTHLEAAHALAEAILGAIGS
jgi:hypothetical protein